MLLKWAIEGRKKRAELSKYPKPVRPSGSRNTSSFTSESSSLPSPREQLTAELNRLEFAHRAVFERSSESAGDRGMRQQRAEEKAMSLRDDALIESGEDPKKRLGRGISDEGNHHDAEETSSIALTTANMQLFTQNARIATLKREEAGPEADDSSVGATMGDNQTMGPISRVSTNNSPTEFRKSG